MRKLSITDVMTQRAADGAAAGSAALAGTAWIADVEPIITAVAGLVAIVAGLVATWYHYERGKYMHRKNVQADNGDSDEAD